VPVNCCDDNSAAEAQKRFKEVDLDGNGKISMDETRKWLVKTFGKDWKRHVDKDDVAAGKVDAKILEIVFNKTDKNRDKSITPEEFDSTLSTAGGDKK
jgi:Ca2+-binding EF-hand superfamily protein